MFERDDNILQSRIGLGKYRLPLFTTFYINYIFLYTIHISVL
jgi:hypothetical protein